MLLPVAVSHEIKRKGAIPCQAWDRTTPIYPSSVNRTNSRPSKGTAIRYTVVYDPWDIMLAGFWLPSSQFEDSVSSGVFDRDDKCLVADRGKWGEPPQRILVRNGQILYPDGTPAGAINKTTNSKSWGSTNK